MRSNRQSSLMVNITFRVLSRPNIDSLATIYRELGSDYDERVLPSIVSEVFETQRR
ncbi:Prohibitin-2, subunit of the prohibitin complex (Phb1p-Phb2p) [Puccinia graminis f. sp. tritici]|uniref:Prohibitin n=1 Tax=Puccinia graminis f. sp. tritici TaxID=56615 RepID=A0A5B0QBI9_PUCGR|nr:Prohibitin-2, subunit of the prohibitin complex (Phb1p-Phb2p) [Puccinia graminis f. sp. tritici]